MTREEIKQSFDLSRDKFDAIKQDNEKEIVSIKYSKCEYFEIFPCSYQRSGFKQGKLVDNINKIKSTEDLYSYGFDSKERIIQIKEGISIENQFYYQFLKYEKNFVKSHQFNNSKDLQNVSIYFYDKVSNKIEKMFSQGRRGGRDEFYIYSENGLLEEIRIKQYDRKGNEADPYKEIFDYSEIGELKQITKSFENGYSEVIYEL
ncbi:hypothetical protein [Algibacter sp. L3A6]|uniref:hypothetical protein n=1 Tax=Algibacter sp. L3A6 TaxID=2686366 RepID=UPI00131BF0D1|nr:hypothetical protein [Algibacter sp. L3A6]